MDNPPSTFNNLPSEVCEVILKQLCQQAALNLRLVNKRWKDLVDELYPNWSIKIGQEGPDLKRILQLKIKKLNITELLKRLPLSLAVRENSSFLKYPDNLENLIMPLGYQVVVGIVPQYLNLLLLHSKNLKYLSLNLNKFNLVKLSKSGSTFYDLAKLIDLKIRIESIPLICPANNPFVQIMNHSDLSKLRSLDININRNYGKNASILWSSVFLFLQTAKSKCKNLMSLTVGGDFNETRDLVSGDIGDCYSTLQNLIISSRSRPGFVENWKKFIECQSALRDLKIVPVLNSARLLLNVVSKNFETLKSVEIKRLESGERMLVDAVSMPYFNLEIFRNCQNLETLDLFAVTRENFINFNKLPATLRKLSLSWGLLDSAEILEFFKRKNKVTCLSIAGAGTTGRFGFNGSILKILLVLPGLKYIDLWDGSINSSVPEEREKLKKIYPSTSVARFTRVVNGIEEIKFPYFQLG